MRPIFIFDVVKSTGTIVRIRRSGTWKPSRSPIPALPQPADMDVSVLIDSTLGSWTYLPRGSWTWIAPCTAKPLTRNIKKDPGISGSWSRTTDYDALSRPENLAMKVRHEGMVCSTDCHPCCDDLGISQLRSSHLLSLNFLWFVW